MDERVMQAAAKVQAWYLASLQTRGLTARGDVAAAAGPSTMGQAAAAGRPASTTTSAGATRRR